MSMPKLCVTHHHACDCREEMFAKRIAELDARELGFVATLSCMEAEAERLRNRIAEMDKERTTLRRALEHVRFYALDNVPPELREMAKVALGGGE